MSISSPSASTIAGVARPSRGTDLRFQQTGVPKRAGFTPAFLLGCTRQSRHPPRLYRCIHLPRMWFFGDSISRMTSGYMRNRNLKLTARWSCVEDPERKTKVKKVLLTTTALIALGIAPCGRRRPCRAALYQSPPPMAVAYNWSGFYAGVNGGWGSSRQRWDETSLGVALSEGSHDATGGTVGGQIGYRWQAGFVGVRRGSAGQLGRLPRQQCDPACSGAHQRHAYRCVRTVHRSGRLRREQRPVLRQGRRRRDLRSLP